MIEFDIELMPGEVIVVGPKGRFILRKFTNGKIHVIVKNCDFIRNGSMSKAHKEFVSETWELRNEDGLIVPEELALRGRVRPAECGDAKKRPETAKKERSLSAGILAGQLLMWAIFGLLVLAMLAYAWPDMVSWWAGSAPVLVGGDP